MNASTPFILVAVAGLTLACSVSEINIEGKECPCVTPSYRCDDKTNRCVRADTTGPGGGSITAGSGAAGATVGTTSTGTGGDCEIDAKLWLHYDFAGNTVGEGGGSSVIVKDKAPELPDVHLSDQGAGGVVIQDDETATFDGRMGRLVSTQGASELCKILDPSGGASQFTLLLRSKSMGETCVNALEECPRIFALGNVPGEPVIELIEYHADDQVSPAPAAMLRINKKPVKIWSTTPSAATGEFGHIALSFDSSAGNIVLYIDGAPVAEVTNQKDKLSTSGGFSCELALGGDYASQAMAGYQWSGHLEDVKLYQGALPGETIACLANR